MFDSTLESLGSRYYFYDEDMTQTTLENGFFPVYFWVILLIRIYKFSGLASNRPCTRTIVIVSYYLLSSLVCVLSGRRIKFVLNSCVSYKMLNQIYIRAVAEMSVGRMGYGMWKAHECDGLHTFIFEFECQINDGLWLPLLTSALSIERMVEISNRM